MGIFIYLSLILGCLFSYLTISIGQVTYTGIITKERAYSQELLLACGLFEFIPFAGIILFVYLLFTYRENYLQKYVYVDDEHWRNFLNSIF